MIEPKATIEPTTQSRLNKALTDNWVLGFILPKPLTKLDKIQRLNQSIPFIDRNSIQFSLKNFTIPAITSKAIAQGFASDN